MTEQPRQLEASPLTLPDESPAAAIARALQRARWMLLWERLWPPLAALATALGLFLALSWLGVWLWLPPLGRIAGLAIIAILILAAALPLVGFRIPRIAEALRRLDRGSGLPHRPATTIADRLAVSANDSYSLALWNTHVARARRAAQALKPGLPAPHVARRDPYALRALVLLAGIATFFAAGGERWQRIAAAFDWHGMTLPANFRVDAWVEPPAYTGKPPIALAGIHPGEAAAHGETQTASNAPLAVPANSTLIVRSTGDVDLDLTASGGLTPAKAQAQAPAGTKEQRFTIAGSGTAALHGSGDNLAWAFTAIPDQPPTIALTKDPEQQNRGSILLSYRLEDDYGVTQAEATFARKDDSATSGGKRSEPPHPLYGPPDFALILPQARTKSGVGQTIKDLTDHPWAGGQVTMTLVAHDDAGNVGKSEPFSFRLPQRVFVKPLARALIEQRRDLAMDANSRQQVATALDALAIAPEKFTPDAGVYLGLRSIYWSLVRARTDDELRDVVSRLWQMAVDIEDGNVSDAQTALRNAENALQEALQRGASDQEIAQLMDKLREAMNRYMQALAEQLRNNQQLARPLNPNAKVLTERDLQNMLDRLENMAKSGAKDAAQALLQQLEQMMENMQMASPGENGDDNDQMSELNQLGDMIRRQQDLRDRTFKQGQNAQRGQHGKPGPTQRPGDQYGGLQQNQQALRDELNRLLQDLKNRGIGQNRQGQNSDQGQPAPGQGEELDQLGRAGEAMGEAEGELGQKDADGAVESQGQALDALRRGAQGLAQSMQQQMGQNGRGRNGRLGEARGDNDTDPLGRPLRGHDYGNDATVKVPGEIDVQRARRIIEELRKRFGDFTRPQEELDYIQRLLKGF